MTAQVRRSDVDRDVVLRSLLRELRTRHKPRMRTHLVRKLFKRPNSASRPRRSVRWGSRKSCDSIEMKKRCETLACAHGARFSMEQQLHKGIDRSDNDEYFNYVQEHTLARPEMEQHARAYLTRILDGDMSGLVKWGVQGRGRRRRRRHPQRHDRRARIRTGRLKRRGVES